jgi:1,4-dihydroxy-2-naphthoate polyprenyltransferase
VTIASVVNFVRLTRPVFLLGGILLYILGVMVAIAEGATVNWLRLITGQLLVTSIQLMTQYSNEYYDIYCDSLNTRRTWFSGGSGVLSSGALSPETARGAALALAGLSLGMILLAGLQVPLLFFLGFISLAAAWSYSGPPLTLVSTGIGEIIASIVVAFLVPIVGYTMQTGQLGSMTLTLVCLPLVLIHFAMLVAFQIPDQEADMAAGKRTLTVRMGASAAVLFHNLALAVSFIIIIGLALTGWPGAQLAWLALPLGIWQVISVHRHLYKPTGRYFWLTIRAVGLLAGTTFLWIAGYVLAGL